MPQRLTQGEVVPVGIDDRIGAFEAETPRLGIKVGLVDLNADHLGQKQVMAAERHNLPDPAFDVHGRLFDNGGRNKIRCNGRQTHLAELVEIPPGANAAPVRGSGQRPRREVDDELPRAAANPL